MTMVINIFVLVLQIYLLIGLLIAVLIQRKGLKKIDATVEGAGVWFRVLTFPGIVALWPILLSKWMGVKKVQTDEN
ncbi:MAG: hypothetical protein AAGA77_14720 [Bacteroidota bacterium]